MQQFFYRAATKDNQIVRGTVKARDINETAEFLRKHQLIPIKISAGNKSSLAITIPFFHKGTTTELVFFTRQLATMLSAGLNLMQSLTILKNQMKNQVFLDALQGIVINVEEGEAFSSALSKYPDIFSPIYISLIKAAETSGLLDQILLRLAETLEKEDKLKSAIRGALLYPAIIVVMMIGVMIIMMTVVIPQLSTLYGNLGGSLPITTQVVVSISNFMIHFWWLLILIFIGIVYVSNKWRKTATGQRVMSIVSLRLPVFGRLNVESIMAEFTRMFGLLVLTDLSVVDALLKSADVVGNDIYRDAIIEVSKKVEKGISIGDALAYSPLFPPIVIEMVRVGEATGKLGDSLQRVAEYFEREVDQLIRTLTTAMEPLIMVFLAVMVGVLIFSIITPIYSIISSIH